MELVALILALLILGTYAWGGIRGAPWVPTRRRDTGRIVALAEPRPEERVADLGCGTGHVLSLFYEKGCAVRGWELAFVPWMIAWIRLGHRERAQISWGDFWGADLSKLDLIYVFLMPEALAKLVPKLRRELQPGARIISYVWPLPDWEHDCVDRVEGQPPLYRHIA
jgi:SAM-dependent methyltransferase